MIINTREAFQIASQVDPTLELSDTRLQRLNRRRILPSSYSRDALFSASATGQTVVFSDFPSPVKTNRFTVGKTPEQSVISAFRRARSKQKIRAKTGHQAIFKYFTLSDLIDKWHSERSILNVTDFHFRDSSIENTVDAYPLSTFNLYPNTKDSIGDLEMMTLVISSRLGFSDSHSDDSDGSNHCFCGAKLWLAWETHEGIAAGLEDSDRQTVTERCEFDMQTFLSLKSAHWFTVEKDQTLFMPGHLTHKVVTLSPYIGVGSFYLSFPNYLRTVTRWLLHEPNWEVLERNGYKQQAFRELFALSARMRTRMDRISKQSRRQWGWDFLPFAADAWRREFSRSDRQRVLDDPVLTLPGSDFFRSLVA
ncbi:MAG: hypothetical protein AAF402_04405 [Pseudomonadota bacterium]